MEMAKRVGLGVLILSVAVLVSSILVQLGSQRKWDGEWIPYPGYEQVRTMALDREDRVWVGFKGGVGTYDGESWTTHTPENSGLTGNLFEAIAFDEQGRAWIGLSGTSREHSTSHEAAVNIFDGESWASYTHRNSPLSSFAVRAIAFDQQGRAWIGADNVYVFDGETWLTHTPDNLRQLGNTVNSIAFDAQGRAWIGRTRPSIGIFDGESWTIHKPDNSGLNCMIFLSIVIDKRDRAWIAGETCKNSLVVTPRTKRWGGGVNVFDGETWTTYNKDNSGLAGNEVEAIAFDQQGNAWIATRKEDRLNVFDGETWVSYEKQVIGLASNIVEAIAFDQQGRAWIATRNWGLHVLEANEFPPIPPWLARLRRLLFSTSLRCVLLNASIGLAFFVFVWPRIRRRQGA